ncbi:MAG: putative lipid II flippase FtsW [Myxococcota bacterium]
MRSRWSRGRAWFASWWPGARDDDGTGGDGGVDMVLAAAVVALVGFGVVMVYSASAFEAAVRFGDAQYYLKRQAVYAVAALFTMGLASRFDYRSLRPMTYPLLLVVVLMLGATIAGLGHRAGNAYRWLAVGPIHIQPSEAAKVVLVLWLAYSLAKKREDQVKSFWVGFVPHMLMVGFLMVLCLQQPDFGSAVVLFLLTLTLLFIAGVKTPHIIVSTMLFAVAGAAAIRLSAYRYARFLSWMNLAEHRQGIAYQPFQSVMSFGSGGVFGLGLGRGLQVLYLPEAHTDFIAAIVGEELGFVGVLVMVGLYVVVVARGVKIALDAPDDYGAYIAFGLSTLLAMQVLLNLSVAMAILPTKGLTLPFISYGGSSLLVSAGAMGILLNISRHRRRRRVDAGGAHPARSRASAPATEAVATA